MARLFCINHNYNKILESNWFLACSIFSWIGAHEAKVSNNKLSSLFIIMIILLLIFISFINFCLYWQFYY